MFSECRGSAIGARILSRTLLLVFSLFALSAQAANLTLTTQASVTEVPTGVSFEYTLRYACASITEDCHDVVLTDPLPAELDTTSSAVSLIASSDVESATYSAPNAVFQFKTPLKAGSTGEVKVAVRFNNGSTPNGTVAVNQPHIEASNVGTVQSNAVSVTATAVSDWALKKYISGPTPALGQDTNYQILIQSSGNTGTLNLEDAIVHDDLPAEAVFVSASADGTYDAGAHRVTWNLGSRSAGTTKKVYVVVRYSAADIVVNNVSLSGQAIGGVAVDLNAQLQHGFNVLKPGIGSFKKQGSRTEAKTEYTVRYYIKFVNNGNVTYDRMVVSDDIPDGLEILQIRAGQQNPDNPPYEGGVPLRIEYATRQNPSLQTLGDYSTDTRSDINVSSLGLAEGERISRIVWTFTDVPPIFAMTYGSRCIGFNARVSSTDSDGNPLPIGYEILNRAEYDIDAAGQTSALSGGNDHLVRVIGDLARPRIDKSVIAGGTLTPESIARYQIQLYNLSTGTGPLVDPVITDLLDENLEYIADEDSWKITNNTAGIAEPAFEAIENYNGSGRTLLRWSFSGDMDLNKRVRIQYDVRVKEGTPVGTLKNVANLVNPDLNSVNWNSCRQEPVDEFDLDGDGDTSEQHCSSRANDGNINVTDAASMSSEKWVRGQLDDAYLQYPNNGLTVVGGDLQYKFKVTNTGNVPMTGLVITDVLPHLGDTGVIDMSARQSEWSPVLIAPITPPAGVTVYYSTETNPCRGDLNPGAPDAELPWPNQADGAPSDCVDAGWSAIPPDDITRVAALRFDFGELVLQALDSQEFVLKMQAPLTAPSNGEIAWSSFGYYATRTDNDETLLPSEPVKVGVSIQAPEPAEIGNRVWLDSDGDGTQNEGPNAGLNGVRVELYEDNGDGVADPANDRFIVFRLTGDDPDGAPGYVLFSNQLPGDYFLRYVRPAGYEITEQNAMAAGVAPNDMDSDADPATGLTEVTRLDQGEIDLRWDMGVSPATTATVGNYVWHDRNGDGIQNESVLDGINGVRVNLYLAGDLSSPVATTTTADDINGNPGYYSFSQVQPDFAHLVELVLPDGATGFTAQSAEGSDANNDSDVDPATGRTGARTFSAGAFDGSWDAGMTLETGTLSLGDRIWIDVDGSGRYDLFGGDQGIDSLRLNLYRDSDGSGDLDPTVDAYVTATLTFTSAGGPGYYRFEGLPPGDYFVQVDPAAFATSGPLNGLEPAVPFVNISNGTDGDQNGAWDDDGQSVVAGPISLAAGETPEEDANAGVDIGFSGEFDWDDLPEPYVSLRDDGGPRHALSSDGGPMLGAEVDAEDDAEVEADANGDSDDGVSVPALTQGESAEISVEVDTAEQSVVLNAWIDFNGDGDFADDGEQITTDLSVSDGSNPLSLDVPLEALADTPLGARFRLSTETGLGPNGAAPDGEVEAQMLSIAAAPEPPPEEPTDEGGGGGGDGSTGGNTGGDTGGGDVATTGDGSGESGGEEGEGGSGGGWIFGTPIDGPYAYLFNQREGDNVYLANHDNECIPLDLNPSLAPVSADLLARVAAALPAGQNIALNQSVDPATLDEPAIIHLIEDGDVWVTFLHEGSNYRNAVGFYAYHEDAPPQSAEEVGHVIIFPNASYTFGGGNEAGLSTGHEAYLGRFPAGTKIGFFMVTDGCAPGATGVEERIEGWTFYSDPALNPEADPELRDHMVLMEDLQTGELILGIEQANREDPASDHDLADLLLAVRVTQGSADTAGLEVLPEIGDSDGDGLIDGSDAYPEDPQRAIDATYPTADERAYLAFEDLWPLEGDYDLNDLVMAYQITEVRDTRGRIKDISFAGEIMARGAGYDDAFGFHFAGEGPQFPGLDPALLESATKTIEGARYEEENGTFPLTPEDGQSALTLILFESAKALSFRNDWDTTCKWTRPPRWFNTDAHCWADQGARVSMDLTFTRPVSREELGNWPYNPFIYPTFSPWSRGREVHLPDHPATDKANTRFFGYRSDTTNPAIGRWYKTAENLPWALNIPREWKHPLEEVAIQNGYPQFVDWANSGGTEHTDWYLNPVDEFLFYVVEPGVFY